MEKPAKVAKRNRQFDYSGSQCLKAVKEEGIECVLVNPNIATIQTDTRLAGKVYFLPVTSEYVEKVIEVEKPDGILLSFGGQTALNCGVELEKGGVLAKYGVRVMGTPVSGIVATEDRDEFKKTMNRAGIPVPKSKAVSTVTDARATAQELGYPVIIRVAYTLGGKGGGVAHNEYELDGIVGRGLTLSLIHQVLVEEYIGGWKQIEYEVMRDHGDNAITVCNMENVFGMRVHTGDNIVVAPSQTITNREYHLLRTASINAARACSIVGECNIQFALDTRSERFYAIEINARLSRSSALASKATGYPLAYVAAKLALGYTLPELINKVTGKTTACFEPSLDYVVLKMPRWDLQKFSRATRKIGTQMKSVGEVMAIGRSFEETLQKAVRMVDIGRAGVVANGREESEALETIEHKLTHATDELLYHVVDAIKAGMPLDKISLLSEIDLWFVSKIKRIVDCETALTRFKGLEASAIPRELLRTAKRLGFSDLQIARTIGVREEDVRGSRIERGIVPVVKQIDTLAAEWPASTNYLYLTYNGDFEDIGFESKKKVVVLGAGTYRIGSSVEFDWCTMHMVWGLKDLGVDEVIVVNCNPETVSTDYDMSDRLYFEELTLERVMDIYEKEQPLGVVCSVGGQIPNSLAPKLSAMGARILGTTSDNIDRAEDRSKFSNLLDQLNIPQPPWSKFISLEEAERFGGKVGYPLLVRPSYVLSGAAMRVVWTPEQLEGFLTRAATVSPEHPVVISKFIRDAMEVEIDAVSDGKNLTVGAVIEHVEKAGVHSGDAIMSIPPQKLPDPTVKLIVERTRMIARALDVKGPINIQYLVKDGEVSVIECNLRASRSMPFVSKVTGTDLIGMASVATMGGSVPNRLDFSVQAGVGVKVPQFSFMQIEGADPVLGVEMQSTGEVACTGTSFFDAFSKALVAAGYQLPRDGGNVLLTVGGPELKKNILPIALELQRLGYHLCATEHTAEYLIENGVRSVTVLHKIGEPDRRPNILEYLAKDMVELIIDIPSAVVFEKYADMLEDEYQIRRRAVELGIPMLTTIETAESFVQGLDWLGQNKPTIAPYVNAERPSE